MGDKQIIIPSATYVPEELQRLGKLPAVIYPINQRPVFDYLYEQYGDICTAMRIICGMGAEKVHQRLSRYTNSEKVIIEDLPEIRDLAYTVWYGVRGIREPIIINFADTIVYDDALENKGDAYYYAEDIPSDKWTYFEEVNGVITEIYDKVDMTHSAKGNKAEKKKLFIGVFQIIHTTFFVECLERTFRENNEKISAFYLALREYSHTYPMTSVCAEKWLDIGHADKYYRTDLAVKAREFNHITIDEHRGILKKTSENQEKFIGEIKWYLKIPKDIEYIHPRIFDFSTEFASPYISMEYYAYRTVHELFLYGDLGRQQWVDIFERVKFVCNDMKRHSIHDAGIQHALEDMYLTKTISRLNELRETSVFSPFFQRPFLINGRIYESLDKICDLLERKIPEYLYDVDSFSIIHGDLCFTNIMIDENFTFIKLIDPRGSFGKYDIYGDFRYELAKLYHSVDGNYDYIIKNLFSISYDLAVPSITYAIQRRKQKYDLFEIFLEVFRSEIGRDGQKIELIEALLFLSMIPLHPESLEQQMVMLATGIEILARHLI